jgi:hypothetical protein
MNQQQKIIYASQQLGVNLAGMQGSTRNVYDTLPNPQLANQTFEFFKNVGQRAFPDTNISDNKFQVGEGLLVEAIGLYGIGAEGIPQEGTIQSIVGNSRAELIIANQSVLKDIPLTDILSQSNTSKGGENRVFYLAPLIGILIPPQLEFTLRVTLETAQGETLGRIGVFMYGTGILTNLKTSL